MGFLFFFCKFCILCTMKDTLKWYKYHCQSYLSAIGVVGIRWVQHSCVLDKWIHFFVQDVKVTGVTKQEGPCQRKGLHPGEDSVKEVAGNVEALIPPSQLHHVTAWTGKHTLGLLLPSAECYSSLISYLCNLFRWEGSTHPSKLNLENWTV